MLKKKLILNFIWQGIHDALNFLLAFAFYSVLARTLGETGVGVYSYVLSLLLIIFVFVDLGINSHLLRKWSADKDSAKNDFFTAVITKIFLLVLTALPTFVFLYILERPLLPLFAAATCYLSLEIPLYLLQTYARSQNKFIQSSLAGIIDRIFFHGVGILMLLNGQPLITVFLIGCLGRVFSLLTFTKIFPQFRISGISRVEIHQLLRLSIPLFMISIFNNIYFKLDTVLIRSFLDLEALGAYSAAYRLIEAMLLIPALTFLSVLPIATTLYKKQAHDNLEKLQENLVQVLLALSILFMMFFISYRLEIIDFAYGANFYESGTTLAILALSLPFFFMNGALTSLFYATHNEKKLFWIYILATLYSVIANIVTIPILGINAAALNTVVCEALISFALYRHLQASFPWKNMVKMLLCSAPFFWILSAFHPPLLIAVLFAGTSYLILMFFLKQLPMELFLEVLHTFLPTRKSV